MRLTSGDNLAGALAPYMTIPRCSAQHRPKRCWTLRFHAPQALWSPFAFAEAARDAAYPTAWASSHPVVRLNFLNGAFLPRCDATTPVAA